MRSIMKGDHVGYIKSATRYEGVLAADIAAAALSSRKVLARWHPPAGGEAMDDAGIRIRDHRRRKKLHDSRPLVQSVLTSST